MDFVVGVLILVVGLMVSIALHEVGHLLPAKRFGVRVPQYMVGFGRTLWSRTVGDTEYGVKAVPLGGYVRMVGMYPPARPRPAGSRGRPTLVETARRESLAEIPAGEEHRAFYALSVPRKLVVMLGGPAMNLLIAAVLLTVVVAGLGMPALTSTLGAVQPCVSEVPTSGCSADDPPSPAAAAGLQPGDEVVAWDGRAVDSWTQLSARIAEGGTDPVPVVVLRDGERRTLRVTPTPAERPVLVDGEYERDAAGEIVTETRPYVGIGPTAELVAQPLTTVPGVVADAVVRTFEIVLTLPQRLAGITEAVLGPAERDPEVVGLVGVGRIAGEIASVEGQGYGLAERTVDMLGMLASLNLALFAFNLVPLLPLDGGHVAGALWEGGRRTVARWRDRPDPGPVDVARALPVTYAVVALMVGMSLLLAYADIVEPVSLTG